MKDPVKRVKLKHLECVAPRTTKRDLCTAMNILATWICRWCKKETMQSYLGKGKEHICINCGEPNLLEPSLT